MASVNEVVHALETDRDSGPQGPELHVRLPGTISRLRLGVGDVLAIEMDFRRRECRFSMLELR